MFTWKRLCMLACAALMLAPGYSFASRNAYRCNGCNAIQYENAATAPQETGVRYVYDFINGNISKYQVSREPNGDGFSYYAEHLSVTAAEQTYFDLAATAWNSNGSSMKAIAYVTVTPTLPGSSVVSPNASAYDIVRSSAMQARMTDWLQSSEFMSSTFEGYIGNLIAVLQRSTAGIAFEKHDLAQLTIVFTFINGHKITLVVKKGSTPAMTAAADGNGNAIPVSASALIGQTYLFGDGDGQDLSRFHQHIELLGATYDNVCNPNATVIACVTSTGIQTCFPFPKCN